MIATQPQTMQDILFVVLVLVLVVGLLCAMMFLLPRMMPGRRMSRVEIRHPWPAAFDEAFKRIDEGFKHGMIIPSYHASHSIDFGGGNAILVLDWYAGIRGDGSVVMVHNSEKTIRDCHPEKAVQVVPARIIARYEHGKGHEYKPL